MQNLDHQLITPLCIGILIIAIYCVDVILCLKAGRVTARISGNVNPARLRGGDQEKLMQ